MNDTVKLLNDIGKSIVKTGQDKLDSYGLQDSNLRNSITYEVNDFGHDEYELIIQNPNYAIFVDKGRGKNKKMPPAKPIEEWMKKKGIPEKASFAIRKSISINGIKARPFLDDMFQKTLEVEDILFDFEKNKINEALEKILKNT